jgi:hypothetical protein
MPRRGTSRRSNMKVTKPDLARTRPQPGPGKLGQREAEVLRLLVAQLAVQQLAARRRAETSGDRERHASR